MNSKWCLMGRGLTSLVPQHSKGISLQWTPFFNSFEIILSISSLPIYLSCNLEIKVSILLNSQSFKCLKKHKSQKNSLHLSHLTNLSPKHLWTNLKHTKKERTHTRTPSHYMCPSKTSPPFCYPLQMQLYY